MIFLAPESILKALSCLYSFYRTLSHFNVPCSNYSWASHTFPFNVFPFPNSRNWLFSHNFICIKVKDSFWVDLYQNRKNGMAPLVCVADVRTRNESESQLGKGHILSQVDHVEERISWSRLDESERQVADARKEVADSSDLKVID